MNNVHPIFAPILESICPSNSKALNDASMGNSPVDPKEKDRQTLIEGFADWLISGKPRLN